MPEPFTGEQIFRAVALAVFAVAAIDVGIAFLIRALSESTPGGRND